jgi:hypothetical protein
LCRPTPSSRGSVLSVFPQVDLPLSFPLVGRLQLVPSSVGSLECSDPISMPLPSASTALRKEGNEAFRIADYDRAAQLYTQAYASVVDMLKGSVDEPDEETKEHLAAILSNRAAARINRFELDLGAVFSPPLSQSLRQTLMSTFGVPSSP